MKLTPLLVGWRKPSTPKVSFESRISYEASLSFPLTQHHQHSPHLTLHLSPREVRQKSTAYGPDNSIHHESPLDQDSRSIYEHRCILPSMIAHTTYATGQSAASFFWNPDMCTFFTRILATARDLPGLLIFRSITRECWNAVMFERTSQKTLMLVPDTEGF